MPKKKAPKKSNFPKLLPFAGGAPTPPMLNQAQPSYHEGLRRGRREGLVDAALAILRELRDA